MSLFGGSRDVSLFRQVNFELHKHHTRVNVDVYKINLEITKPNIYGEAEEKAYYNPVRVPCLIDMEDSEANINEFGLNKTQQATLLFTRDILIEQNLYIEIGDIVGWNGNYWEVNNTSQDKLFYEKDPNLPQQTIGLDNQSTGWNVEFICNVHLLRNTQIKLHGTFKR